MDNSELRRIAREKLGGSIFHKNWLMLLCAILITGALTTALTTLDELVFGFKYTYDVDWQTSYTVNFSLGVLTFLFGGLVSYGACSIFLNFVRGKTTIDLLDVFDGFKDFKRVFPTTLLVSVFTLLWTLLFIVPGIVKTYSYAMTPYVRKDNPDFTPKQCIDESRRLMNGRKLDLFLLDLSFIGWALIGVLCCCIGASWVSVYSATARAEFYQSLLSEQYGINGEKTDAFADDNGFNAEM